MRIQVTKPLHLFAILSLLLLIGCSSSTPITRVQGIESTLVMDFSPYANRGFLFSPDPYSGGYQGMGMIDIMIVPDMQRRVEQSRVSTRLGQGVSVNKTVGEWKQEPIYPSTMVERAFQEAKDLGADAIVNLDVTPVLEEVEVGTPPEVLEMRGYRLTGFAIKRQ